MCLLRLITLVFWRHEPGAIVVVALKNKLKRSGLGYGKITLGDRWPPNRGLHDHQSWLELDGERRFLLRL